MTVSTLKFATDFSDIQTNAPFDVAGRVNQIFGYTQKRLDARKELSKDLPNKELRYLALVKLFEKVIKPEIEQLLDDENGGFDIAELKRETEAKSLVERLDYLSYQLGFKARNNFEPKILAQMSSVLGDNSIRLISVMDGRIGKALENVFQTMFGLINTIPQVYKQKFKTNIGVADYKKAVDGIYKLLSAMSEMHISVFNQLAITGKACKPDSTRHFHDFKEELFDYYDPALTKDKLMMLPSAKFFETLHDPQLGRSVEYMDIAMGERGDTSERINYGCPATYVETKHGNMIRSFYLWSKKLIEKVIYLDLERLLAV